MTDSRAPGQEQCEVHGDPLLLYEWGVLISLVDSAPSFNREVKAGRVTFGGIVPLCGDLSPNDKRHRLLGTSWEP